MAARMASSKTKGKKGNSIMSKAIKYLLWVILATVLIFAIGLIVRPLALRLSLNFGIHATLAAFLYGMLIVIYELKTEHAWPIALGSLIYGALMSTMSPIMGVAALVPAVIYAVGFVIMRRADANIEMRAIVGGTIYAACVYVGVILGGLIFGAHAFIASDLAFLLLTTGLGLLGSLLGTVVGKRPRHNAN